jgi:hypothetical protein
MSRSNKTRVARPITASSGIWLISLATWTLKAMKLAGLTSDCRIGWYSAYHSST